MGGESRPGKIAWLSQLRAQYPAQYCYDLACLGVNPDQVGETWEWETVYWIIEEVVSRPDTALGAKLQGLDYPISRVDAVLRDFIDIYIRSNSGKQHNQAYPRPFKTSQDNTRRYGSPRADAREILASSSPVKQ